MLQSRNWKILNIQPESDSECTARAWAVHAELSASSKTIYFERASINTRHCPLVFTIHPLGPTYDKCEKAASSTEEVRSFDIERTKINAGHARTFWARHVAPFISRTPHLTLSFGSPANVKKREKRRNIYLPKHPSAGMSRYTTVRGATRSRRLSDIIFLVVVGGREISSVFKSDRVLAINDDAVFLGGRAALII